MSDRRLIGRTGLRVAVGVAVLVLAVAGLVANQWFATARERSVVQVFDREQLLLARQAAVMIERELGLLEREVGALAEELTADGFSPAADLPRLGRELSRLRGSGAARAAVVDPVGGVAWIQPAAGGPPRQVPAQRVAESLPGGRLPGGEVWVGEPRREGAGMLLPLVAPLGPGAGGHLLLVEVNLGRLLDPFLEPVRSGQSGYAWLIDERGRFLHHPDASFLGEDAFEVRARRYPGADYERINRLQREQMLQGREGVAAYASGRRAGGAVQVEKLIAYTPLHPVPGAAARDSAAAAGADGGTGADAGASAARAWSLAVVAPLSDLQGALEKGRRAQVVLGLVVLGLVLLAALSVVLAEVRWADVLERRVEERTGALGRSEERYRSLIEASEDAIFTLDRELRLESFNATTARLLGAEAAELPGREYGSLLPSEAADRQRQLARRVLAAGRGVRGEFARETPAGRVWLDAGYMPLRDERARVSRVLCIARDVTERRRLEQNLASTEKLAAMGTLAAGFAHEINNPLGVMLGFAELLRDRLPGGSPEREDLEVIQRQGLACKRIVDGLLAIARAEEETTEHSDLNRAIENVVQVVRHNLEIRGIELELDLGEWIPPVRGDARRLEQVFLNLVTNAIAALPAGGRLHISTGHDRLLAEAVAAFTDNGTGIAPQDLPRIFEPFFTTKPPGEGTGLGLFVSYGIVGRYGGRIECESRLATDGRPGRTTFTVRLRTQARSAEA